MKTLIFLAVLKITALIVLGIIIGYEFGASLGWASSLFTWLIMPPTFIGGMEMKISNQIQLSKIKELEEKIKKHCNRMLASGKDKDYWYGFRSGYQDALADVIKELE